MSIYQVDPSKKYNYYYCHLKKYSAGLRVGDKVRRGQVIGYVGVSGRASGPHLHFQISRIKDLKRLWAGIPINPYPIFAKKTDTVLALSPQRRVNRTDRIKGAGRLAARSGNGRRA